MGDPEVAALANAGDADAFSALVIKHKSNLLSFIGQYITHPQDAEDVCQESFKKAFLALSSYDHAYSFSTWLFTIAKNTALDHLRRQTTQKNDIIVTNSVGDPSQSSMDIPDPVNSPEDAMITSQTCDAMTKAIDNLPDIYREVARLRFIEEYPYEEIAKTLNLPLNTVRTRIRRARELLR